MFKSKWLRTLLAPVLVLLACELFLRLGGRPHGTFAPLFRSSRGLYPESAVIPMSWGPIPYVVRTNSLGFRGEEIPRVKERGTLRIVTIGDSATDGFFVENDSTWQYRLEDVLNGRMGRRVEVVNCARGGGSIDWELGVLRSFGVELRPDLVVLTFVANDISELLGKAPDQISRSVAGRPRLGGRETVSRLLAVRTGIGETLLEAYLSVRSPSFRERKKMMADGLRGAGREIDGAKDHGRNAAEYLRRYGETDGLVLGGSFDRKTADALDSYLAALRVFAETCENGGARLLFVYFPAYPQTYDREAPRLINERLRDACRRMDIDFFDLTDGFREAGRDQVLYFAPLDFHPNSRGHAAFAALLADPIASMFQGTATGG